MANPNKVGLVFGAVFALVHVVWSILVATGLGQSLYDFVLWANMVHLSVVIGPFDATAFVTLIIVTALVGYLVGYVGATVWNKVHRS